MGKKPQQLYYQCRLKRDTTETTIWVEARAAKRGATIELLPDHTRWQVQQVYKNTPLPEDTLKALQLMHRNSLPSVDGMH